MRKLFLILAIAGLMVGLIGSAQAAVQLFRVDGVLVSDGRVEGVFGRILCTEGMTYRVEGAIRDEQGNRARFTETGECTGDPQEWFTANVVSETGFSCDEPVVVQGRRGTAEDESGARFRQASNTVCAA